MKSPSPLSIEEREQIIKDGEAKLLEMYSDISYEEAYEAMCLLLPAPQEFVRRYGPACYKATLLLAVTTATGRMLLEREKQEIEKAKQIESN